MAGQERDEELQGLQQKLAEAEEAHEEELLDMQATVKSCTTRLQDTKVGLADSIIAGSKTNMHPCPVSPSISEWQATDELSRKRTERIAG